MPFVAKAIGLPIAGIAIARDGGREAVGVLAQAIEESRTLRSKEAVLPFNRFPGVDTILGPEMKSTGEVMGLDTDFGRAFAKSQIGGGTKLPLAGTVFISVKDADKEIRHRSPRPSSAWASRSWLRAGPPNIFRRQGYRSG